jgi:hypothetical protein
MGWNLNKYNTFEFLSYGSCYDNIFHFEKLLVLAGGAKHNFKECQRHGWKHE